ncbi:hypothetical protein NP233_g1740 [Leucocoprinus birnbaumii]|uniref:NACHT domain-containing protein n=1 Tax=Leucocoprinus birnbaumii TaxID=56174 RepID=A0AAD5VZK5_9AGAR|nr:hypothetical protein NP233_g1740 [Leucocoprinus birnbaumii]
MSLSESPEVHQERRAKRRREPSPSDAALTQRYPPLHSEGDGSAQGVYKPSHMFTRGVSVELYGSKGEQRSTSTATREYIQSSTTRPATIQDSGSLPSYTPVIHEPPPTPVVSDGTSSGFFPGAHSFEITDSHFTEVHGNVTSNTYTLHNATVVNRTNENEIEVFGLLSERTIHGAEHDSSERNDPPLCHPGTRLDVRGEAQGWLRDQHRSEKILWLHGPAGVGKSAVMQSLADDESDSLDPILGATFFFSRPKGFVDAQCLFTTIAHQLATRYPSYRHYIVKLLTRDRGIPNKKMALQFRYFIKEPFSTTALQGLPDNVVILLDGLDECIGIEVQREIVLLIGHFSLEFPTSRLTWAIASRPEAHIKESFALLGHTNTFTYKEVSLLVDSDQACCDVERFLWDSFHDVRRRYSSSFPPSRQWPAEVEVLKIASAASGHFGFASVIMKFIIDEDRGNPVAGLEMVMEVIQKATLPNNKPQPLALLDAMYTQILSTVPTDVLPTTMILLSIMARHNLQNERIPLFVYGRSIFVMLCEWLKLTQDDVNGSPKPYHASFTDFLISPKRSGRFHAQDPIPEVLAGAAQFMLEAYHPMSNTINPSRITSKWADALCSRNLQTDEDELYLFHLTFCTIVHHLPEFWSQEVASSDLGKALTVFLKNMDYTYRSFPVPHPAMFADFSLQLQPWKAGVFVPEFQSSPSIWTLLIFMDLREVVHRDPLGHLHPINPGFLR